MLEIEAEVIKEMIETHAVRKCFVLLPLVPHGMEACRKCGAMTSYYMGTVMPGKYKVRWEYDGKHEKHTCEDVSDKEWLNAWYMYVEQCRDVDRSISDTFRSLAKQCMGVDSAAEHFYSELSKTVNFMLKDKRVPKSR